MFDKIKEFFRNLKMADEPTPVPNPAPKLTPKSLYTTFDPELTLPDSIFGAFDESFNMQSFFESKGSYLATYTVNGKTAVQIINDACRPYAVNQKFIVVLLQKEQGAWSIKDITKISPHSVYTRYKDANGKYVMKADGITYDRKEFVIKPDEWCLGFGVPDDDPPNPKFQGFENQITNCARRVRELFTQGQKMIGRTFKTLDYTVLTENLRRGRSQKEIEQMIKNQNIYLEYVKKFGLKLSTDPEKYLVVTLKNQWTYLLYMYTPHVQAQELTHKLWNQEWPEDLQISRS
jgi:hypothetical protein